MRTSNKFLLHYNEHHGEHNEVKILEMVVLLAWIGCLHCLLSWWEGTTDNFMISGGKYLSTYITSGGTYCAFEALSLMGFIEDDVLSKGTTSFVIDMKSLLEW
ncbi:uncharacterized protein LOC113319664 [Papaver somniferum]|uniref:uncharacterized protein LOC113319664 n=1 Tax=Papaver somniferum TaxID=3469 RepID=UPI000E6F9DB7|nr:uncharacterized protein LOC113319664 [Papaver somniferum]